MITTTSRTGFDIIALREKDEGGGIGQGGHANHEYSTRFNICYRLNLLVETTSIHESSGQVDQAGGEMKFVIEPSSQSPFLY